MYKTHDRNKRNTKTKETEVDNSTRQRAALTRSFLSHFLSLNYKRVRR